MFAYDSGQYTSHVHKVWEYPLSFILCFLKSVELSLSSSLVLIEVTSYVLATYILL